MLDLAAVSSSPVHAILDFVLDEKIAMSSGFFLESTSDLVSIDKKRLHRQCAGRATEADALSTLRGYRLVPGVSDVRPGRLPVVPGTGRMAV